MENFTLGLLEIFLIRDGGINALPLCELCKCLLNKQAAHEEQNNFEGKLCNPDIFKCLEFIVSQNKSCPGCIEMNNSARPEDDSWHWKNRFPAILGHFITSHLAAANSKRGSNSSWRSGSRQVPAFCTTQGIIRTILWAKREVMYVKYLEAIHRPNRKSLVLIFYH